jgi:RNA polymerase-interacting CarD/CdnL/TRCF family regulator
VILTVGSTVVYPCQGPCLVGAAVERIVADEPRSFYHLVALYDSGGELFVPVDKVRAIGTRLLAQRSDIPKLQDHLMETTKVAKDWKQRANDILKTVHLRIGV